MLMPDNIPPRKHNKIIENGIFGGGVATPPDLLLLRSSQNQRETLTLVPVEWLRSGEKAESPLLCALASNQVLPPCRR
jgi:hypothetical protein